MKNKLKLISRALLGFVSGFCPGIIGAPPVETMSSSNSSHWDSPRDNHWPEGFQVITIPSTMDGAMQPAYAFQSASDKAMPLVVSLHSWSGDYRQYDPLAEKVAKEGFHYIHPDFRGPNNTSESCASELALQDIDDAISYCIANWAVDSRRIYIIGSSGGGHATCATYFRTKHPVSAFFAWVPITDIVSWYYQTRQRGLKYAEDIEEVCGGTFDAAIAGKRSPVQMRIPEREARLHLFAGINDGYSGSVPISHSLLLFNLLASDHDRITDEDIIALLSKEVNPTGSQIGNRDVYYRKESARCSLTIFEGGHEMLVDFAANQIVRQAAHDTVANAPSFGY